MLQLDQSPLLTHQAYPKKETQKLIFLGLNILLMSVLQGLPTWEAHHPRQNPNYVPAFKIPRIDPTLEEINARIRKTAEEMNEMEKYQPYASLNEVPGILRLGHASFAGYKINRLAITVQGSHSMDQPIIEISTAGQVVGTYTANCWNNHPDIFITDDINLIFPKCHKFRMRVTNCGKTVKYCFEINEYCAGLDWIGGYFWQAPQPKTDEVVYGTHHDIELKNGKTGTRITAYISPVTDG